VTNYKGMLCKVKWFISNNFDTEDMNVLRFIEKISKYFGFFSILTPTKLYDMIIIVSIFFLLNFILSHLSFCTYLLIYF